ncbi:hypothetical protein BJX68DRAFT_270552 [Aspergillus pseudodeflectus]|uniref:Fungal N-terminal domain-containing protein n=1 Tax=Aspergillus pseudodeflectus TaxID=176178 RepID=A0ABR4JRE8_9EURO
MSNNNTQIQRLSCDDSPLSITGSIISIATLAYAVILTIVLYVRAFASVNEDRLEFGDRLFGEIHSLKFVMDLLQEYLAATPPQVATQVQRWLFEASEAFDHVMHRLEGGREGTLGSGDGSRQDFINRARFVADRKGLDEDFAKVAVKRTQLEGVYQAVMVG